MEGDFWQHRINNYDWDYWWIVTDDRLRLVTEDRNFKNFLCSLLHPVVRDLEETFELLEIINSYLIYDGYKLVEDRKVYSGTIFKIIEIDNTTLDIEKSLKTNNEFVQEHYRKIDNKIKEEDFSGVITNSRSLVESVIGDIYTRIVGEELDGQGNLQDGYKKIKTLLRLNEDDTSNNAFKSILRSFVTIIDGLDRLSNQMGDRHRAFTKAQRNYALFCANSAKIFVNFLYGVLDYQYGENENIYNRFLELLDGNRRTFSRASLLKDAEIVKLLVKTDPFLRSVFRNRLITEYQIDSFRQSDIFFAFLGILFDSLSKKDVLTIFNKEKNNNQALGLIPFLKYCKVNKEELVNDKTIEAYLVANDDEIDLDKIPF